MLEVDKFDETGYPTIHIKVCIRAIYPKVANKELMTQLFQQTLTDAELKWFLF